MSDNECNVPRIFELMKERKLTARQVSDATSIPASNFTEWKKGRSNPRYPVLKVLAEYFCVPVEYLAGSDQDHNALDLKIQSEIQQLSEEQKTDVLKYIKFVKSE